MKKHLLVFALLFLAISSNYAQKNQPDKSCSVILLDNKWLIKSYNKDEKISLDKNSKGQLSVHETGDIANKSYLKGLIKFEVAILRKEDNTLESFSDNSLETVEIETILKKCAVGDKIYIIVKNAKYSLPHHQLEVI